MKASKKIVGAACALIAAAALSAGSTFAWFSSNEKVEVTGMRLQAVVPDALFIKEGIVTSVAAITETSLNYADSETTKLNPAVVEANEGGESTEWAVKYAETYKTNPTGGTPGEADKLTALGTFDNASTDFLSTDDTKPNLPKEYATMYVMSLARINNKTGAELQAEVEFTFDNSDGDNTYKFLRCGFLCGTRWTSIANEEATDVCAYDTTAKTVTFSYKGTNAVYDEFDGNTAYQIQFVVWFDGPDKDCYVNNALETHNISVKITYEVEDVAQS